MSFVLLFLLVDSSWSSPPSGGGSSVLRRQDQDRPPLLIILHGQIIPEDELSSYCLRIQEMIRQGAHILEIHAYTVARPTPEPFATPLDATALERIADVIRQSTGLPVTAFS